MNFRLLFLVLYIAAISFSANAQAHKGYNRLYLSYSKQNYRDKKSLKYDGLQPDNYIIPLNTDSHCWGLQFERVMKSGFLINLELQYGVRRYNLSGLQDMTNFDPNGIDLAGKLFIMGNQLASVNYWGPRVMVGYRKKWNEKWAFTAKIGCSDKLFFDDGHGTYDIDFQYKTGNGRLTSVTAATMELHYGRVADYRRQWRFPNTLPAYEFYLGAERQVNKSIVKNITLGLEASRGFWMWDGHETVIIRSSPNINQLLTSKDIFIDRNICIGLRVAVGLWR